MAVGGRPWRAVVALAGVRGGGGLVSLTRPPDALLVARGVPAVLRRRLTPGERRAAEGVRPGPGVTQPLERVELNHTPLDLIVEEVRAGTTR